MMVLSKFSRLLTFFCAAFLLFVIDYFVVCVHQCNGINVLKIWLLNHFLIEM